jgi:HIRAN domain-containing protein
MARRRVFRTRVTCPGVRDDLGPTANQRAFIGRIVKLERKSSSGVSLLLDGTAVGELDGPIATRVVSALECGQVFTATVEKAFPTYNEKLKPSGAQLDIRVEYLLEKGQPAIETESCWRCVPATEPAQAIRSFFTTVAGVTFDGRQRIVARCSVGERLVLVRDPDNRFDKGAIKVMRLNGEQLGFIPEHVSRGGDSSGLASRIDRGEKYGCRISDLTGGGEKTLGVNIEITDTEDFEAPEMAAVTSAPHVGGNLSWVFVIGTLLLVAALIAIARG